MLKEENYSWESPPDARTVFQLSRRIVGFKARLRIAEEELNILVAEAKKQKPRTPYVEVIGANESDKDMFLAKRREIIDIKNEIDAMEADESLALFQRDMYRTHSYKTDRYVK